MIKRRYTMVGLVLVSLILALTLSACGIKSSTAGTASVGTGVIEVTRVSDVIEASGTLEAEQSASLAWKTSGTVAEVMVAAGDTVPAGTELLTLDSASVQASVINAEADRINASKALNDLIQPDSAALAKARQNLASAYQTLDSARSSLQSAVSAASSSLDADSRTTFDDTVSTLSDAAAALPLAVQPLEVQRYVQALRMVEQTSADLDTARKLDAAEAVIAQRETAYETARSERDTLRDAVDSDSADLAEDLVQAEVEYEQAFVDLLDTLDGTRASTDGIKLETAWTAYLTARENQSDQLTALVEKMVAPSTDDLTSAQAKLNAAQSTLDMLHIAAPFAGEVLNVVNQPGDVVAANSTAIVLADRSLLHVTVQVDETEIASISVGDAAEITLDALPDETVTGVVALINPAGKTVQGIVKFEVRVDITGEFSAALLGATANVTIQTSEPAENLTAPIAAVQSDQSGEFVMVIRSDGTSERVAVQTGQIFGSRVTVTGNLQEGDQVSLVKSATKLPGSMGMGR